MALDYRALLSDLRFESAQLMSVLETLTERQWDLATPASGWAVRDQVSHLAYFDDSTCMAVTDPERFRIDSAALIAGGMDFPDRIAVLLHSLNSVELQAWFVHARTQLLTVLADGKPKDRLPWFGPDMSLASCATARLMETWAHGQDIYDALGLTYRKSPGLRSIAHLGVSTFAFVHRLNDLPVPEAPVRVELTAPDSSAIWSWGPEDALNRVVGPAEDFVLAVTQRRHLTDTTLEVNGDVAQTWMSIAQAYAGASGTGRAPLTHSTAKVTT